MDTLMVSKQATADARAMIDHFNATRKHVQRVQHYLNAFAYELMNRATVHDESKYGPEEAEHFARVVPRLAGSTYGSDEYKATLREIKPAINHHNANNSHHPEHYPNGVDGMTLMDFVEMFCDWKAAGERHDNGDMRQSIMKNEERFKLAPQVRSMMLNTVPWIEAHK